MTGRSFAMDARAGRARAGAARGARARAGAATESKAKRGKGGGRKGRKGVDDSAYEVVVGLETHVQLKTDTKAFCRCANVSSARERAAPADPAPNSRVCPVCLGHPGTLPVLSAGVKDLAVRAGVALGGRIRAHSRFDRKQYFYPDLPKGYQISQYDEPIIEDGAVHVQTAAAAGDVRRVRVVRAHIEEDSGKSSHAAAVAPSPSSPSGAAAGRDTALTGSEYSLVDYNRAGIPLLEIVTAPDLRGGAEAAEYAKELARLLRCAGVSDCSMALGEFRCDVNVSVRPRAAPGAGEAPLGTKVEVKNLNSFSAMQRAVEFEALRHISVIEARAAAAAAGEPAPAGIVPETRLWDESEQVTRSMRKKETLADYRYFPEPDLPPLFVREEEIAAVRGALPELPHERRRRVLEAYFGGAGAPSVSVEEMMTLCETAALCEYFERTVRFRSPAGAGASPREALNYLLRDIIAFLARNKIDDPFSIALTPEKFAEVLLLIEADVVSGKTAKEVLIPAVIEGGGDPAAIVEERGLAQISDAGEIDAMVDAVVRDGGAQLAQYLGGKTKLKGFFQGQLMKVSGGRINPKLAAAALDARLAREQAEHDGGV